MQSANGGVQDAMLQLPPAQPGVPLATEHCLTQVPQWLTFELVSTSQPSLGLLLQSA
jgi:hypothetical protein